MPRISPGQIAATTLQTWLSSQLTGGIVVYDRWAEPSVQRGTKVIAVSKVGVRRSTDVIPNEAELTTRVNLTSTTMQLVVPMGRYEQDLTLDCWVTNDVDREDMIAQLDDALNTGPGLSVPSSGGDPFEYGVLLAIAVSGFSGFIDYSFDDPEITDDADSNQTNEYHLVYPGVARGVFSQVRTMTRLVAAQIKVKGYDTTDPDPNQLYETTTLSVNPTPPPAVIVTHGTST